MRYKILFSILFSFLLINGFAQQHPDPKSIRIVDTMTKQEKANRNPIILKAELDSMIQLHNAGLPPQVQIQTVPVKEVVTKIPTWIVIAVIIAVLFIIILLYGLFNYQKRLSRTVSDLKRLIQNFDFYSASGSAGSATDRSSKSKTALEKKISGLSEELEKQKQSNQLLQQEYESIKQAIAEVYKIRNYPAYDKEKNEEQVIKELLVTERTVAIHAFEKFLKPVLTIADANKNNPAKISVEDSGKMLELLISLSLYYIEYLYLRVNDLSVGGNIVERIGSNGKGIDPALLKKLNTEHGSRALALRMALNKSGIDKLTYPVFDETDLNNF
jgi:hypothetical protein